MNYNNKRFRAISNSDNGEVSDDMVFHYRQTGEILHCEYYGVNIVLGHLIGIVDKSGQIDMRYHQVNLKGEILTGVCASRPETLNNGKIRLHEEWQWTSGDMSKGDSVLEEI